jgi:hypothetical protein
MRGDEERRRSGRRWGKQLDLNKHNDEIISVCLFIDLPSYHPFPTLQNRDIPIPILNLSGERQEKLKFPSP